MGVSFLYLSPLLAQTHDISFLPNEGQWDDFVQFRADLSNGVFWMEEAGFTAWVAGVGYDEIWAHNDFDAEGYPQELHSHAWKATFINANTQSLKTGANELGYKVNYLRGNDPNKWVESLDPVSTVLYEGVWPSINLRMDGSGKGSQRLKYD